MDIFVEKILERDMDFLIMREFATNHLFAELFLSQIGIEQSTVTGIAHSVRDNELGESDIIIYLLSGDKRIALMIEVKVDAHQQDRQAERYNERDHKMMEHDEIDDFHVFIAAPDNYLSSVVEYNNAVSFEQMLMVISDELNMAIIKRAFQERKDGYQPVRHDGVTSFWQEFYHLIDDEFPHLSNKISRIASPRGARAAWPGFSTWDKNMKIHYKSDKGFVDLQLNGMGQRLSQLIPMTDKKFPNHDFIITKTGKSASLRLFVPIINFKEEFSPQKQAIVEGLNAVTRLETIAKQIPIYDLLT